MPFETAASDPDGIGTDGRLAWLGLHAEVIRDRKWAGLRRRMQVAAKRRTKYRTLYRGDSVPPQDLERLRPGDPWTTPRLLSASAEILVAFEFCFEKTSLSIEGFVPVVFEFEDPRGLRGLVVMPTLDPEREVIMPAGSRFEVVTAADRGAVWRVTLRATV